MSVWVCVLLLSVTPVNSVRNMPLEPGCLACFFGHSHSVALQRQQRTHQSLLCFDFHHRSAGEALDRAPIIIKDFVIEIDLISAGQTINFHRPPLPSFGRPSTTPPFLPRASWILALILDVRSVNLVELFYHFINSLKRFV